MNAEQKKLFGALTLLQKEICTNILKGMSTRDAYRNSTGKATSDNAIDSTVSQIMGNIKVKAFMDSMQIREVDDAILSREEALKILTNHAKTNLSDLVDFATNEVKSNSGKVLRQTTWSIKDSALQDKNKLKAISELVSGKDGLKIKTHSPLQAIKQIAEMEGWNKTPATTKDDNVLEHQDRPTVACPK